MSEQIKLQYAKIIDENTHEVQIGVGCDVAYYIEIGMEYMETEQAYDGRWYVKGCAPKEPDPEPKTREEIRKTREDLYKDIVDPITAQIQRLRDEEQTIWIKRDIDTLIKKRSYEMTRIRLENPYPEEA